jgi:hypothetical protein
MADGYRTTESQTVREKIFTTTISLVENIFKERTNYGRAWTAAVSLMHDRSISPAKRR